MHLVRTSCTVVKFLAQKLFSTWMNNPHEKVQISPLHLKFPPNSTVPTIDTVMMGYVARSAGKECYVF